MKSGAFGACGRTRTGDLLITSELLYQLSHTSIAAISFFIIGANAPVVKSKIPKIRIFCENNGSGAAAPVLIICLF